MTRIANISLDIRKNDIFDNDPIILRQGESDVIIEASISNDGYPDIEIEFATFVAKKADGTIISNDPANVNGNVISYPISKHLTESVGKIQDAYFVINNEVTTCGFDISIIPSTQLDDTSVNYIPGIENINKFLESAENDWLGRIQQMKAQIDGLDIPKEFKLLMDKALSEAKDQYQPIIDTAKKNVDNIIAELAAKKLDMEKNSDELDKAIATIKTQVTSVTSFLDNIQKQIIDANTSFTAGQQAQVSQSIADGQKKLADSIASMQSKFETDSENLKSQGDQVIADLKNSSNSAIADMQKSQSMAMAKVNQNITDTNASIQQIQQSVKNTNDSIQNMEKNMKVGGRNYLLGTGIPLTVKGLNIANQNSGQDYYLSVKNAAELFKIGLNFTISFDWTATPDATGSFLFQFNDTPWAFSDNTTVDKNHLSGHYSYSFTEPESVLTQNNSATGIYPRLDNFTGAITFSKVKLEIGNIPTDWTPAPEDDQTAIKELQQKISQSGSGKIDQQFDIKKVGEIND